MSVDDRPGAGERGSITLMLLALFLALTALAGIVIDGGAKLDQAENANAVAQEAARAGAGMVDPAQAYASGSFVVDQAQAQAAAEQYLAARGLQCPVQCQVSTPTPDTIQVTVTMTSPTRVLSIVGIDSMSSTGSATASLVTGVTTLIALVIGLPLALYWLGGDPLPGHAPMWHTVVADLVHRDESGAVFLGAVRDLSWVAWAAFTVAVWIA